MLFVDIKKWWCMWLQSRLNIIADVAVDDEYILSAQIREPYRQTKIDDYNGSVHFLVVPPKDKIVQITRETVSVVTSQIYEC